MVRNVKIASTNSSELAPIGGQIERDFERITDYIKAQLGPDYAAIFSEPVASRDGVRIDWYAAHTGRVEALAALSEEVAAPVRAQLGQIVYAIQDHANHLLSGPDPEQRALGRALLNAICFPDDTHIYVLDGKPVLVAWGYRLAHRKVYRGDLKKVAPIQLSQEKSSSPQAYVPSPDPPLAQSVQEDLPHEANEKKRYWAWLTALLWVLLAALIAAILYLLITACAITILPWFNYCQGPNILDAAHLSRLYMQVLSLEEQLAQKADNCDQSASLTDREINQRLLDRAAGEGALQVSLAWNGEKDLDLAIRCDGSAIWFKKKKSCGGELDIDSNGGRHSTSQPVENIVWRDPATIPSGSLPIFVTYYSLKGQSPSPVPYTLRIVRRQGDQVISSQIIQGIAKPEGLNESVQVGFADQANQ